MIKEFALPFSRPLSLLSLSLFITGAFPDCEAPEEPIDCTPALEAATCSEPAAVVCRDASLVELSMTAEETTPGLFANEPLDGGGFHATVDATAGGFNGTGGFVY